MAETHWYIFSMYSSTTAVGETKSQLATLYSWSGSSRSASEMSEAICTAKFCGTRGAKASTLGKQEASGSERARRGGKERDELQREEARV